MIIYPQQTAAAAAATTFDLGPAFPLNVCERDTTTYKKQAHRPPSFYLGVSFAPIFLVFKEKKTLKKTYFTRGFLFKLKCV